MPARPKMINVLLNIFDAIISYKKNVKMSKCNIS